MKVMNRRGILPVQYILPLTGVEEGSGGSGWDRGLSLKGQDKGMTARRIGPDPTSRDPEAHVPHSTGQELYRGL